MNSIMEDLKEKQMEINQACYCMKKTTDDRKIQIVEDTCQQMERSATVTCIFTRKERRQLALTGTVNAAHFLGG